MSKCFIHDARDPNEPLMPYTDAEGFTRMVPRCQAHVLLCPECRDAGAHFYANADPTDRAWSSVSAIGIGTTSCRPSNSSRTSSKRAAGVTRKANETEGP